MLPRPELIVLDGKAPHHTGGQRGLTAVTVPSQHYLGCLRVADKSNEIPAARERFARLALAGRAVSLDALHPQAETARALGLEHGADYLLSRQRQPAHGAGQQRAPRRHPAGGFSPLKAQRRKPAPTSATKAVSRRDDQCRVRARKGVWVQGSFSRRANSLFREWRSHQRKPPHHSTTTFAAQMAAEHGRRVFLTVTTRRPNRHSRS